jgi:hypothetical protein
VSTTPTGPEVLFEDTSIVTSIAVDGDAVYWSTVGADSVGAVMRRGKRDGVVHVLADGQAAPYQVVLSGESVLWLNSKSGSSAIMKVDRAGGTPTTLAPLKMSGSSFVVRDGFVYFIDTTDVFPPPMLPLRSVPVSGGASALVTSIPTGALSLAFDGSDFFYLVDSVMALPKTGGDPKRVGDPCFYPNQLALDGPRVFWACQDGTVRSVAKAGGASTTLFARATTAGNIGGLAIDASSVYFTSATDGTVNRVPKSGGATVVLAAGEPVPDFLTVDESFVYYTVGKTGDKHAIKRVAK